MITPLLFMASQLEKIKTLQGKGYTSAGAETTSHREQMIILGVIAAVGLILFLGVLLFRRRRHETLSRAERGRIIMEQKPDRSSSSGRRRRKWRERRRDHRPRNPTRAEAGGLPPEQRPDGHKPPA